MSFSNVNFDQIGRTVVLFVIMAVLVWLGIWIYQRAERAVKARKKQQKKANKVEDDFFFGEIKDIKHLK